MDTKLIVELYTWPWCSGKQPRCALIGILTVAHKADYISSFLDTLRAQHAHGVIVRVLQPLQIRLHHTLQGLVGK